MDALYIVQGNLVSNYAQRWSEKTGRFLVHDNGLHIYNINN